MDKEKFYTAMGGRSVSAASKRSTQMRNWDSSATNKESESIKPSRLVPKVQFGDSVVFLAAAQSGDVEEVERLLTEGADVNAINSDGLTGLHQCCIDDDFEMVETLVKHGANMDAQDNEGWSPLHAAASCGHNHIVRFLLESGAHPALVNNEGDTPLDLIDEQEEMASLFSTHIETHHIDMEAVKGLEETRMLEDVNRLKNDPSLTPPISSGGATLLHVASAKGYLSVLQVLMSMKVDVDSLDDDGWTPLHASVYWRNMEAAELLVSHGADITRTTNAGDTIEDLVDPELAEGLDSLKKIKEEANNRHRHYAVPRSSRPSLSHSNSREELKSPNLLRRRSSKERSLAVHRLDKEREKFPEIIDKTADVNIISNHNANESTTTSEDRLQETHNSTNDAPPPNALPPNAIPPNALPPNDPPPNGPATTEGGSFSSNENSSVDPSGSVLEVSISPDISPNSSPQLMAKMAPGAKSPPKQLVKKGMSPNMLKRVGLWESQSSLPTPPLASSTPTIATEAKRFPFQPRTLSDATVMSRPSKQDIAQKRASYDERKLREGLPPPPTEYKASSLPRGATVTPVPVPVISTSLPRGSRIHAPPDKPTPDKDRLAAPDETLEGKPKENVDGVSSSGAPTPGADTTADSRETSADSTNRSLGTESETKRKQHARRSRQQRQPTQPVDNEIVKRLMAQDKLKEDKLKEEEKSDGGMSAFKPPSRPSPRGPPHHLSVPPWSLNTQEESSPDASPPVKPKILTTTEDDDDRTPSRTKSKSSTRRRPKKERRSTGLPFEAEEGEDIPEELANIIVRKSTEPSPADSGDEDLRGQLAREKEVRERVTKEKDDLLLVVEGLQGKVSELNRRHADATRAYEQEKREGEVKEARIAELEMSTKNLQDMKKECQRLKDENSALIRVIGKLSRSPLPSSTV
ncbi:protein phosphatase 1 regulatory subunit 12A-like isoform X3 [Halichondria panicea]|uniref:protein phosphatase 1 regulatory subunit 12A-like isoform X3 n=1 Tax=Halichondria panicea TaxID=6063 RepID=UPI00312B6780